jgi:prepilin peptidase CpaA
MVAAPPPGELLLTFAAAFATFAVAFFCFWSGWFGGGDVKLLSAAILLIGARDAMTFLMLMALAGGALSVVVVIWTLVGRWRIRRQATAPGMPGPDGESAVAMMTVPYAVAISAAALLILFSQLHQS